MTPLDIADLVDAHCDWMATVVLPNGRRYSPRTIAFRRQVLGIAHRHLPHGLDDVTNTEIEAWLATPGWKRWTAATYYNQLAGFYRQAAATGQMTGDPTLGIPRPPSGLCRPRPVTPAEISHALAHSPEPWHACIILAAGAGLRASELAEIRREDITAELVHVRCGKGGKERYVDTCASLWAYVEPLPPGLLVRRPPARPVTGPWLSSHQAAHWRSVGLPGWHLHRLRHTFCTTMWQAGGDPLAIRDLMGHVSIATTQGYAQVASLARRQAIAAVDALLAGAPARA